MSFEIKLDSNILRVKKLLESTAERILEESADIIESQVKRNTAVDTGRLKGSWQHKVNMAEKKVTIGSPLENAIWEEFGTGEYALNGDGRKGGWVYFDKRATIEYTDIEIDGLLVKMEGATVKTGEKGTIEAVVVDLEPDNIKMSLNGEAEYTDPEEILGTTKASVIKTKSNINAGDYINNLALVARRLDNGKVFAIVFKKALCTSGFELDMKNKNVAGNKYTFEAVAPLSDTNTDTLPIRIISEDEF